MLEKLKFITSGVWQFLKPIILVLLSRVGPILIEATTAAVAAAAGMPVGTTGAQKRDMAFSIITAAIAREGLSVGASVINACIESAVVKIRSEQPGA